MAHDDHHPSAFRGFLSPTTTQVPDELFDELLSTLTGAELKVLLYIVRRTFGFKRMADNISLNQICHGITTADGRVLDRGTGLSQSTVLVALKSLTQRRVIVAVRRASAEKCNEATTYSLNLATPFPENRGTPSPKNEEGLPRKLGTQHTGEQETASTQQHPLAPSPAPRTSAAASPPADVVVLEQTLMERGISPPVARLLARRFPAAQIQEKLEVFDYLRSIGSPLIAQSPAGWLRMAIEQNYYPSAQYLRAKASRERRQERAEHEVQTRAEQLQQEAERYATPPEERARRHVMMIETSYETMQRPPLTAEQRQERLAQLITRYTRERDAFLAEHPALMHVAPALQASTATAVAREKRRTSENE